MTQFACPVCGFPDLTEPPRSEATGAGSHEVCPVCGFQFGVTDDDQGETYESWRQKWHDAGMPWHSQEAGVVLRLDADARREVELRRETAAPPTIHVDRDQYVAKDLTGLPGVLQRWSDSLNLLVARGTMRVYRSGTPFQLKKLDAAALLPDPDLWDLKDYLFNVCIGFGLLAPFFGLVMVVPAYVLQRTGHSSTIVLGVGGFVMGFCLGGAFYGVRGYIYANKAFNRLHADERRIKRDYEYDDRIRELIAIARMNQWAIVFELVGAVLFAINGIRY